MSDKRGKRIHPSILTARTLHDAFEQDQLLERFGSQLMNIGSSVGKHADNDPGDVAKVQSLLVASGFGSFEDITEPTARNHRQHLEQPIRQFQRRAGLQVDGKLNPEGPTMQALGSVVRRRQDGQGRAAGSGNRPINAPLRPELRVAQRASARRFTPGQKPKPPQQRVVIPNEVYSGEFKDALAKRESNVDGYQSHNKTGGRLGALGRYQMRAGILQDLGVVDKNDNWLPGNKYGVTGVQDFLNDPKAQEQIFEDAVTKYAGRVKGRGATKIIGQVIDGKKSRFQLTEAGLVAAAHKQGAGGVELYLEKLKELGWRSKGIKLSNNKKENDVMLAVETRLREFGKIKLRN